MLNHINRFALIVSLVLTVEQRSPGAIDASVQYDAAPLGGVRWQFTYDVANVSLSPAISEFTIWFDRSTYRNLSIGTPNPPASSWNEIVVEPDLLLSANGFYDAAAITTGIAAGSHVSGFTVSFDWLGSGQPGSQPFDIVDPANFATRFSGATLPEPSAAMLFIAAIPLLRRRLFRFGSRTHRS